MKRLAGVFLALILWLGTVQTVQAKWDQGGGGGSRRGAITPPVSPPSWTMWGHYVNSMGPNGQTSYLAVNNDPWWLWGNPYANNSHHPRQRTEPQPKPSSPPCTPQYGPPEIDLNSAQTNPAYPLTMGQDPSQEGFTVTVTARGGAKTNNCPGPARANITAFRVVAIHLAESSRRWITQELAPWYPGAHVKGTYPAAPDWVRPSGLNSPAATLTLHHSPLDPGHYEIVLRVEQDRGNQRSATATLDVPVYLLETTIVK